MKSEKASNPTTNNFSNMYTVKMSLINCSINLTGKNLKEFVCPPEFVNALVKFK